MKASFKVFINSLKSKGSIWTSNEQVQLHEHATEYLANALKQLRSNKKNLQKQWNGPVDIFKPGGYIIDKRNIRDQLKSGS